MGQNSKYYGIRFDRRSQNFGFHMIARSQLIADDRRRSQTIADDRRSVFPYDRRRSQNFLRSAIRDPPSSAIIWKPALIVKPNSRSVNAPYRPLTTWLKHGFVCVFLPRSDLTTFIYIELNPCTYHLGSSSFQLNRALPISLSPIYSTEWLRTCFNRQR